jgi:heavy metal translocating P-type ATPase
VDQTAPPETTGEHAHGCSHIETFDLIRIGVTLLAAALVWYRVWEPFPRASFIGIAGVLFGGWPIFREAFDDILERRMTMELSMTIALAAALAIGEFFTALIITAFVLVAELLEGLTVSRGRRAIGDLLNLLPRSAWIVKAGMPPEEVPTQKIGAGDRVLIRPGARIPVDGVVVSGHSNVEEAAITGEPLPQDKLPGSRVFAGTMNQTGALEVAVETLGRNTTFGKIVEAVETAEQTRAPIQRLADRLAGYLVYFALGSAFMTLLITHNLRSTISVVIVAGACGIAAGTPLAVLGAIGRCARQGTIIKGGIYLEQLAKVNTVLLDKTGTLTCGKPSVTALNAARATMEDELLALAASAERNSEHPLALAIIAAARERQLMIADPEVFSYTPGRGVCAEMDGHRALVGNRLLMEEAKVALPAMKTTVGTRVYVARDQCYLGSIDISDPPRQGAAEAIQELARMGIRTELITGDTSASASAVAECLRIEEISSGLLPQQKAQRVDELIKSGRTVAMIGDGINDAPALARAHVGVAMGGGTELAHASAHVLLIGNDLNKFAASLKTARWCRAVIYQNFYGTLIVDAAGIALAAAGWIHPLLAAFIHVSSEMIFILNSARLLPAFSPAETTNAPPPDSDQRMRASGGPIAVSHPQSEMYGRRLP